MRISYFENGYSDLKPAGVIDDWNEFCDVLADPKIGSKNGSYYVRGECIGERNNANIKSIDLLIIDGDQLLHDGTTCCPPQGVHECLKNENITHIIHSSHSNDIINNRHKWRLIMPYNQDISNGAAEIISLLHSKGLMIKNVDENEVISQPWFFPRCNESSIDDFFVAWHDGEQYNQGKYNIIDTARRSFFIEKSERKDEQSKGCFSWEYVINQFKSGTIHIGIKSACGWLTKTTDWADIQIKQHLLALINATCPNHEKVSRANNTKEIDNLIAYCRKKSGITNEGEIDNAGWKNHLISADMLKDKEFLPIKWAVDEIIPEGLSILAGDPKVGKSLVAVDICSAVASGACAFGYKKCVEGGAIYFSLEDPERRIKSRILNQCDLWPNTFRVVTGGVPSLGPDFYKMMDDILLMYPDTRIVVIDTLQFIIPPKKHNVADYDHYYLYLDPLHRFALDNGISVVCITHKNKAKANGDDNPFASIIGSVAIQGTSDAMLMLAKNHAKKNNDLNIPDGFLHVIGREVESFKYALEFDSESTKWVLKHDRPDEDNKKQGNKFLIRKVLEKKKLTPNEISIETNINRSTVRSCLNRMKKSGEIDKDGDMFFIVGKNYDVDCGW